MRSLTLLLVIAAVVTVLTLGSGYAFARGMDKDTMACKDQFYALDSGGKGYLTYHDFQEGYNGTGIRNSRTIGVVGGGPAGLGYSAFTSANTSRDGELTLDQFCAWKNR